MSDVVRFPRVRPAPAEERAAVRSALLDERGRWTGSATPVVRPHGDGWLAVFCLPRPESDHVFLDVNCVTDRLRADQGWMEDLDAEDADGRPVRLATAAVELPRGWRGGYRFLPMAERDAVDPSAWGLARRSGSVAGADPQTVWPGAPFSPVAELAVPDAPARSWAPRRPSDESSSPVPEPVEGPRLPGADPAAVSASVVRIPGGRGTVVFSDGVQLLHFGAHRALAALEEPPAVVLAFGRAGDPARVTMLDADPEAREAVLAWADGHRAAEGPFVVAGASLGGAAATYWGASSEPGRVDGVVALSGSFWMRDPQGEPVWAGVFGEGAATDVGFHIAWGTCEVKLDEVNREALEALQGAGVRVTTRNWVGGHDMLHWSDELAEGFRLVTRRTFTQSQG